MIIAWQCLKSSIAADQNVLSLVMKAGFTIKIQRRSVKEKFGLQEMIHLQPKFVDNVLLAIFFMKSGFTAIIPLANGKTVTAKRYTEECLSNVLKQVENYRCLNDLLMHHHTNNGIFRSSTY